MADDTKYRTLDLFSGIGGISLGLQRWCQTVCYCEIDPYAVGVLIKNMAAGNIDVAPIWSDVTTLGRTELDAIGRIDCIAGGFPCQDISCAGKEKGIIKGETRSGLFFEIVRLIRLVRPRIVFLENVPAITVRGLDTVLRELAESGYNARWKVLSAAEVGAPHKRDRWFIITTNTNCPTTNSDVVNRRTTIDKQSQGIRGENWKQFGLVAGKVAPTIWRSAGRWANPRPLLVRKDDGLQFGVDRLRGCGNSVVPQCVEKAFEILYEDIECDQ